MNNPSSFEPWELMLPALSLNTYQLVDIRERDEVLNNPLLHHPCTHMPLSSFCSHLDPNTRYLFFCARGRRSHTLVKRLRQEGHTNVYSLIGGIQAFEEQAPR